MACGPVDAGSCLHCRNVSAFAGLIVRGRGGFKDINDNKDVKDARERNSRKIAASIFLVVLRGVRVLRSCLTGVIG